MLEHVEYRRGSARQHLLPGAPGVDPLDQSGLDPDVDFCGFPFHAENIVRRAARRSMIRAKIDILRTFRQPLRPGTSQPSFLGVTGDQRRKLTPIK
jgi:hypothetical protein